MSRTILFIIPLLMGTIIGCFIGMSVLIVSNVHDGRAFAGVAVVSFLGSLGTTLARHWKRSC